MNILSDFEAHKRDEDFDREDAKRRRPAVSHAEKVAFADAMTSPPRDHDEEIQRAPRGREKRTCSHSLYECVGCQVAREESEKREAEESKAPCLVCQEPIHEMDLCRAHHREFLGWQGNLNPARFAAYILRDALEDVRAVLLGSPTSCRVCARKGKPPGGAVHFADCPALIIDKTIGPVRPKTYGLA